MAQLRCKTLLVYEQIICTYQVLWTHLVQTARIFGLCTSVVKTASW